MHLMWQKDSKNLGLYADIFKNNISTQAQDHFHSFNKKVSETTAKLVALKLNEKNDEMSLDFRIDGNNKFQEKEWLEAMSSYNQSLCYAEIGSKNVSLAYANRSACFFHLKMYDKCLVDIELAKQANYPNDLMPKLDKRRKDCLKLMETFESKYKLSYEADKKFPEMANVLEIRCNNKFGRHVIAKTDIPAGQTILVEKPFIARFVNTNYNNCAVCVNISMNFIACSQCTTALFCNSDCANANEMHKMDCAEHFQYSGSGSPLEYYIGAIFFIINNFTNVENFIEFVEAAIKKKRKGAPHSLDNVKSKLRALLQFSSNNYGNTEKSQDHHLSEAYTIYNTLLLRKSIQNLFETEQEKRFLMHLVLHLKCVMSNNGFTSRQIKMSIYIISSYFNHACASNMIGMNTDENLRFSKTTRPIKAGQQLFINYFDDVNSEDTVDECQARIYKNFGFRCKCERCKPNMILWAMNSNNMQSDEDYQLLHIQNNDIMNDGVGTIDEERRKIVGKKIVDLLNRFGDKHWCDELAALVASYETFF